MLFARRSATTPRPPGKAMLKMIAIFVASLLGISSRIEASTYYVRLVAPNSNGTLLPSGTYRCLTRELNKCTLQNVHLTTIRPLPMHHTGFLSAANKASKHDVTVDISAGAFSQWELSTVAGSSALTTASSIGRSFAGMASQLAAVACSRSVQFNTFGEQHADESGPFSPRPITR